MLRRIFFTIFDKLRHDFFFVRIVFGMNNNLIIFIVEVGNVIEFSMKKKLVFFHRSRLKFGGRQGKNRISIRWQKAV
ncbi:MAG: hypothetical protein RLZZ292_3491 [Bacteroidota bacterium]